MTTTARPRRPAGQQVVAAAPRLRARARAERAARRSSRLRRFLLALAVLAPVAALGWLVLLSPVLGVAQVEVTGTARTAPDAVVAAAHVRPGTPLARVGVDAVAGRVRAALPPVADVRVRRVWPRTLRLQVTERQPAAGVARPDGVVLLSSDGVAFATEPALPPGVPGLELAAPGRDDPATRAALAVLTELPPGLRRQVAVVRATTGSDVQLVLADQRTVVWGRSGAAPEKAATLTALLRLPGTFFDVSAPGVAVRR